LSDWAALQPKGEICCRLAADALASNYQVNC
jgi:hypothetical protein